MKKIIFLLCIAASIIACKNEKENQEISETETSEEKTGFTQFKKDGTQKEASKYKTFRGEFIYTEDAAVLKGGNFIHGVTIDDKMHELAKMVAPVKNDQYDMVPVTVKGELVANPRFVETGEGWRLNVTIKEIIKVSDAPAEADLKIQEKTE